MNAMKKVAVAVSGALVCVGAAQAQSLNINFAPTAAPPVQSTYGAGAGQVGTWNQITVPTGINMPLVGLNGAATGVTISLDGGTMLFFNNSAPNGAATAPGSNAENLLDAFWDPGSAGQITISGLASGMYDIYTYAVAPDGTFTTPITINGNTQSVGGTLPNPFNEGYALGLTHALHTVNHVAGNLLIISGDGPSFESINGIQLVLVPAPAGLAVLGMFGLVGSRRRRA